MRKRTVKIIGDGRLEIQKGMNAIGISYREASIWTWNSFYLTPSNCRRLCEAGLQICDEMEKV